MVHGINILPKQCTEYAWIICRDAKQVYNVMLKCNIYVLPCHLNASSGDRTNDLGSKLVSQLAVAWTHSL